MARMVCDRLAQPHLISQQGRLAFDEERHALPLICSERVGQLHAAQRVIRNLAGSSLTGHSTAGLRPVLRVNGRVPRNRGRSREQG